MPYGHDDDCPLSDPETFMSPVTSGLPCTCKKDPSMQEAPDATRESLLVAALSDLVDAVENNVLTEDIHPEIIIRAKDVLRRGKGIPDAGVNR